MIKKLKKKGIKQVELRKVHAGECDTVATNSDQVRCAYITDTAEACCPAFC